MGIISVEPSAEVVKDPTTGNLSHEFGQGGIGFEDGLVFSCDDGVPREDSVEAGTSHESSDY
jgi:hypothetical protein